MFIYIYMYMHTFVYTYVFILFHSFFCYALYVYIYLCLRLRLCVCVWFGVFVDVCIDTHTQTHAFTHACTHINTHTHVAGKCGSLEQAHTTLDSLLVYAEAHAHMDAAKNDAGSNAAVTPATDVGTTLSSQEDTLPLQAAAISDSRRGVGLKGANRCKKVGHSIGADVLRGFNTLIDSNLRFSQSEAAYTLLVRKREYVRMRGRARDKNMVCKRDRRGV